MPRIARVVVPDYPHHITQRGINKVEIFIDHEDRRYFLHYLKDWSKRADTKVWAYCLMSNHFHLLLGPAREDSLGRCLHGMTFRYAQHFNLKYVRSGRLWQNRKGKNGEEGRGLEMVKCEGIYKGNEGRYFEFSRLAK